MQFLLLLGVAAAEGNIATTLDFAVDKHSKSLHNSKLFSKIQVQSDAPNAAGLNAILEMGSDRQKVAILLDTGSDLFWIRKKSCSTCFKAEDFDSGSFDTSTSTTYSASSGNFVTESLGSYGYGDGTTLLNCELAVDRMIIGALNVPNQTFCAVNRMSSPNVPINNGLMGLSIPSAKIGAANIFNVNGLKPYFGFWYHTISGNVYDGGKITLGGDDPSLRSGDLTTIPASTSTGRFTISLTEVSIGNTVIASGNTSVLVDTGTVATLFPTALANSLNSRLARLIDDDCGANNQEIVSFTFGIGIQPIKMKLSQLLIKDGGQCFSYIRSSSSITILGSWFLQAYYTAFDYEASTISFAKPAAITSFVAPKLPNEKGKGLSTVLVAAIVLGGLLILAIIIYLIYQQFQKRKSANLTPPPMQQQYQYPQFQNGGQPNYYPQQPPGQYPQQSGIPPQYPQQAYNAPPQSQYPQLSSQRPQSEQYVSNPPQLSNQRPMSDQYPQLANQASQINQQYPTFQGPGTPPIQGQSEQPRIVSVENQV